MQARAAVYLAIAILLWMARVGKAPTAGQKESSALPPLTLEVEFDTYGTPVKDTGFMVVLTNMSATQVTIMDPTFWDSALHFDFRDRDGKPVEMRSAPHLPRGIPVRDFRTLDPGSSLRRRFQWSELFPLSQTDGAQLHMIPSYSVDKSAIEAFGAKLPARICTDPITAIGVTVTYMDGKFTLTRLPGIEPARTLPKEVLLTKAAIRAVEQNDLAALKVLLHQGLDLHSNNPFAPDERLANSLLMQAAPKDSLGIFRLLLDSGADVSTPCNRTSLFWDISWRRDLPDCMQTLQEHGVKVSRQELNQALVGAVTLNHVSSVEFLLSKGADPNTRDNGIRCRTGMTQEQIRNYRGPRVLQIAESQLQAGRWIEREASLRQIIRLLQRHGGKS